MGIRLKLLAPLLLLTALLLIGFKLFVWPQFLAEHLEEYLIDEQQKIEILGNALIHPLRNSDLAQVYSILQNVQEKNEHWIYINLQDNEGVRLYPLTEAQPLANSRHVTLQHTLDFFSITVARLSVTIDLAPINHRHNQFIIKGELLIFLLFLVIVAISILFQEKLITAPLQNLANAARQMAAGNFDAPLLKGGYDEVGLLTRSFNSMREEVKNSHKELHELAHHDALTGLPNRVMFQDRLEHAIDMSNRTQKPLGLMLIDIDNFKSINDTLGHVAGDELLISVSQRLSEIMRKGDTLARQGGDEFMAILENINNIDDAKMVAEKLVNAFRQPVSAGEHQIPISLSIGITFYPNDTNEISSLIQNADIAMYRAKAAGGASYELFSQGMHKNRHAGIEMRTSLYYALARNQYFLEYQPRIDIKTGKIDCVEALIRWQHPERGRVGPVEFIPLLEQTGLIIDVSEWVFQECCRFILKQIESGEDVIRVSINLSARQFRDPLLLSKIQNALNLYCVPAHYIEFELTEGVVIENTLSAIKVMDLLHEMGVKLSIDDFGTGYSSLSYLKRFPVDYLKIDRSFVQNLPEDREDAAIVRAIIALSRSLNIETVAEGVETEHQLQFLKTADCEVAQGYWYNKPIIESATLDLIKQQSRLKTDAMQNTA